MFRLPNNAGAVQALPLSVARVGPLRLVLSLTIFLQKHPGKSAPYLKPIN